MAIFWIRFHIFFVRNTFLITYVQEINFWQAAVVNFHRKNSKIVYASVCLLFSSNWSQQRWLVFWIHIWASFIRQKRSRGQFADFSKVYSNFKLCLFVSIRFPQLLLFWFFYFIFHGLHKTRGAYLVDGEI